jgi:Flp pilus assembly protein TadG
MTRRTPLIRAREERGQVIPLVALMIVVLLGIAGLTIDVGNAWLQKRRLQSSVDLALLSAAQKLPNIAVASSDAKTYLLTNWNKVTGAPVTTTTSTGCQVAGCAQPDKITLSATATIPSYFAKLFGIDTWTVTAHGAACGPCDSSTSKFDVIVVLDRTYSMCLDSAGNYNGCSDLVAAIAGVKSLLGFFNPQTDRIGLVLLGSADTTAPFDHAGPAAPCDTANVSDYAVSGKGPFYKTLGDFMDGTPSSRDSWLVAPLNNDFKNPDGSLNSSSKLVSTLNCVQSKFWTPIAPAIDEARQELVNNGRSDAKGVIVYMGDGGANVQPMQRDANGNPLATQSWYTPTPGNNLLPCHDAVAQAQRAKSAGIDIYTLGYDLNASDANTCYKNNRPIDSSQVESGIDARSAMQQMATPDGRHFYEKVGPGEVSTIFASIGRQITSGGTRLTE